MHLALQLAVASLLFLPVAASATLIGEDAELSYFFPDLATQFTGPGYAPQQFTVGAGTEVAFFGTCRIPTCP